MTTNWQPPPGQPPAQQPKGRPTPKRFAIVAALLVVIAGLAAGAGLVMIDRGNDTATSDDVSYVAMQSDIPDPVFEDRGAEGADPFMPLEVSFAAFKADVEEDLREDGIELLEGAEDGRQVEIPEFDVAALREEAKTGIFGGTAENTCDPERLISFLYANPDIGEIWAAVQGIHFNEIASYIRSLEVRVTSQEARVLNHGMRDGAAYEVDTILEAGTAVLVDSNGDIRARCFCGNPIKPKPPQHMPPRCVVWIEYIFTAPGGLERRENAKRDVLLTGRETIVGGGRWVEVKWGTTEEESGWVTSDNLAMHYCPPPKVEWKCPGPGQVPVFEGPNEDVQAGWHTGTLNLIDGPTDIFGPVDAPGGLNPVVTNNGFMMINFKQAHDSVQNSAWIRLADLNQGEEDCAPISQCIDTNGPVWERAGGAIHSPGGVMRVEFTGRFVIEPVTHTEVRLVEEGGTLGWVSTFYTPLADEECNEIVYECVTDHGGAGSFVYNTSNEVGFSHLGHLYNAKVTVLGAPVDGRVPVRMANGGPDGWVDQTDFVPDATQCEPVVHCYITTAGAWSTYPAGPAQATDLAALGAPVDIGRVGKLVDAMGGIPPVQRIEYLGQRYWIPVGNLIAVADADCDGGEETPDCEQLGLPTRVDFVPQSGIAELAANGQFAGPEVEIGVPDDREDPERPERPISRCCVSALFDTPDLADPLIGLPVPILVTVVDTIVINNPGPEFWFVTDTLGANDYFMQAHVVPNGDCQGICPTPNTYPTLDRLEVSGDLLVGGVVEVAKPISHLPPANDADCCVNVAYTDIESGIEGAGTWPRFVEVASGPHAPAPGWYMTTDGDWFDTTNVMPAGVCERVDCPTPMVPGTYDLSALEEKTELKPVLSLLLPGDTAECCVQGQTYNTASNDSPGVDLIDAETVIVVGIDGDWYQVIVGGDILAWVHVSQFVDLAECDDIPEGCFSNQGGDQVLVQDDRDELRAIIAAEGVTCCVAGRVLTVTPADADGGDFVSIAPPVYGEVVGLDDVTPGGPFYEVETDDYGTVWARGANFVDAGDCDRDATCPGASLIDVIQTGAASFNACCVTMLDAAGAQMYKVVLLTGATRDNGAGVTEYETFENGWILETDFVAAQDCQLKECPTGVTVAANETCPTPPQPQPTPQPTPRPTVPPVASCTNSDNDSICDASDNCVFNDNENQLDSDGDLRGDECDNCPFGDFDGDEVCDDQDNCREKANPGQRNSDGDTLGDACDNCPTVTNGFQTDLNNNLIGDDCETPPCPQDRQGPNNLCCEEGSFYYEGLCTIRCPGGTLTPVGTPCPEPCPEERLTSTGCCPEGTFVLRGQCFIECPNAKPVPYGQPCMKTCTDGSTVPVTEDCPVVIGIAPTACPSIQYYPGGCCPAGTRAVPNPIAANLYRCEDL